MPASIYLLLYTMADTNNTPDILINNRRGGIAESDTLMRDWDCANMRNLDGRSEPSVLKLNKEVRVTSSTGTSIAVNFVDGMAFCKNWSIYNIWSNTALYTITGVAQLLSVTRFTITSAWHEAIYVWFYRPTTNTQTIKSFCIPVLTWWSINFAWTVTDYFTVYDYQSWTSVPFLETTLHDNVYIINHEDDFMYVSVGKKIFVANQPFCTETWGRLEYYFSLEQNIAWLSRSWYIINIYLTNWLKYFWQWIENRTTTWSIDLGIKKVQWVWSWKNYDYVIGVWFTGESNCIFLSQWQDIQILKEWNYIIDWWQQKSKFYIQPTAPNPQRCAFNHNMTFFPMIWDQWLGITSLWIRNEITSKARLNEYLNNNITQIWALWYGTDINATPELHFWVEIWWQCYIYTIDFINKSPNNLKYQTTGTRYTKKYVSPNTKQRTATRFRFRYDLPANTTLDIYYSIDWTNIYTLLWTLPPWQKDFEWIKINWSTTPRYEIQFKLVYTTTDITKTPKLYTMEVYASNSSR